MKDHDTTTAAHVPSIRIWLCGPLQIEWTDPTTGQISVLREQDVRSTTDATQALSLLKILLCQPGRQAHRDWLLEQFWPEHAHSVAVHRFHNITSAFRKLLCPPDGVSLLPPITGKRDSSSQYTLPAYPRLWVDRDAALWNVEQAARMHRFGDDALPFWQRAYELLKRGPFLVDEPYAEWARGHRELLEGCYRQCVHALWRLLVERHGEAGKAEALLLLRMYWQQHKTDEDILRPLMELLGEQERYQEAEEYYTQLLHSLAELDQEDGRTLREPDERTRDVRDYLQAKQIRRERPLLHALEKNKLLVPSSFSVSSSPLAIQIPLVPNNQGILLPFTSFSSSNGVFLPESLPIGMTTTSSTDCDVWFGVKQAQIITNIVQWKHRAPFCGELQEQVSLEIMMFDQIRPLFENEEKYTLSRRQALISIVMLPVALLKTTPQEHPLGLDVEDFLPRCAASITAVYHLLKGKELFMIKEVLAEFLPILISLSRKSSPYQEVAAQLASQSCLLMSLMSRHRGNNGNNLALDEWYSREALSYSERTTNRLLKIAALKQLADTCYYREQYREMFLAYEKAWHYIVSAPHVDEIPLVLRARISLGFAYACVKNGDTERAKNLLSLARETFPQPVSDDQTPLYADCGIHSLYLWGGLTRRLLNQPDEAEKTFAWIEQLPSKNILIPERTRVEIVTHQAETAIVQGNRDAFCTYFTSAMNGITRIGSEKRRQEAMDVYRQAQNAWPHEAPVLKLANLFIPLH